MNYFKNTKIFCAYTGKIAIRREGSRDDKFVGSESELLAMNYGIIMYERRDQSGGLLSKSAQRYSVYGCDGDEFEVWDDDILEITERFVYWVWDKGSTLV